MMPPYKWKVTIKGKREIRQRPQDQEAKASSHLSTKVQSIRDFSIVVVSDLLLQVNPLDVTIFRASSLPERQFHLGTLSKIAFCVTHNQCFYLII